MPPHFVLLHGIQPGAAMSDLWSEPLRIAVGIERARWHAPNSNALLSSAAQEKRGNTFMQRRSGNLFGDALCYYAPSLSGASDKTIRERDEASLIEMIESNVPPGSPLVIAAHSWGTVRAFHMLAGLQSKWGAGRFPLRRIVYFGAALGLTNRPHTLFEATHGTFNLRAEWFPGGRWLFCHDPVSGSLCTCTPPPQEEWVPWTIHSTLWRSERLKQLLSEVK